MIERDTFDLNISFHCALKRLKRFSFYPRRLLLRSSNFQVDILETKKVILHGSINLRIWSRDPVDPWP